MTNFLRNDEGAVTVDWVVLTAALVGLGVATVASVRSGVQSLASDVSSSLSSAAVVSLGTLGSTAGPVVPSGVPVSLPMPAPAPDPDPIPMPILLAPDDL